MTESEESDLETEIITDNAFMILNDIIIINNCNELNDVIMYHLLAHSCLEHKHNTYYG